ncbi:hypothetical protein, partial [Nitrosomonas eutropha]|uniref:hypothetical protein n=1 Tax=Nitrosomonas eutropha TaxID=916 RepID=UPI001C432AA0
TVDMSACTGPISSRPAHSSIPFKYSPSLISLLRNLPVGIHNVQTITSYPNPSQATSQNHFYTPQRPKTTFSSGTSQDFKKPVLEQKS